MWGDEIFTDSERKDTTMLIKLAFLVSMRILGPSLPMIDTCKILRLYDYVFVVGNDVRELHHRFNEDLASVRWRLPLMSGSIKSYIPLYFDTSRQHPALFDQLTSQDDEDEDESDEESDNDENLG